MTRTKGDSKAPKPAAVREAQVCAGCGGDCPNCEGVVRPARKGAGRPRKYCCYNCRQRATSRAYHRREFQKAPEDGRAEKSGDLGRAIKGHQRKGHDGKPCPNPVMGDKSACPVLAQLYDDQREEMGLNRMYVELAEGK